MNLQDFEAQYREAMAETLNELQTAVLLLAQVQNKILTIGTSVQHISQQVEEFIEEQKPNKGMPSKKTIYGNKSTLFQL